MTEIIIDKKKFILLPEKDYKVLQKQAALKRNPNKYSLLKMHVLTEKKMIRKWAEEK